MGNGQQIATSVTILSSMLGFQAISLTEMATDVAPDISAGSKVEIASAFFSFDSDDTPQASTWAAISDGETAYLTLTPSGSSGSQILTSKWSNSAPVYSTSKQGWYASAASTVRYVAGCYRTAEDLYRSKFIIENPYGESRSVDEFNMVPSSTYSSAMTYVTTHQERSMYINIGEWDMQSTGDRTFSFNVQKIASVNAWINPDANLGYYTKLDYMPSSGTTPSGIINIDERNATRTVITLTRSPGSAFEAAAYSGTASTVSSRGFMMIQYLV